MAHIAIRPLRFLVNCTSALSSIPFVWNSKTQELNLMKSKYNIRLLWWYLNIVLMSMFTMYHCIRFIYSFFDGVTEGYAMILHFFWVNMSLNSLINECTLLSSRDGVLDFVNQLLRFLKAMNNSYCHKKLKPPIVSFGELVIVAGYQHTCLATCLYLEDPTNPRYIYSLFAKSYEEATFMGIVLFAVLEIYFLLQNWNIIFFYVCIMFAYISGLKFWMDEVCQDAGDKLTKPTLRTPETMMHVYRSMQILNNRFNHFWRPTILPVHKLAVIISTVVCAYGAVRVFGKVKLLSYMSQPLKCGINTSYQLMAYPIAGRMLADSNEIFASWTKGKDKALLKNIQSCRQLQIEVGSYYIMNRGTTFTALGAVIDNSVNLLLAGF